MSTSVNTLSAAGHARVQVGPTIYQSEDRCLKALRVTDPRHDKKRIEDDKGGLQANVYSWVLNNAEFRRWRNGDGQLLWVKGDPGKGKTMLLCGIINELEKVGGSLVAYFFCQATDTRINSATAVLRGLIYLLVDREPSLLSHIRKRYDHAGEQLFEDVNAWVALSEIFTDILHDTRLKPTYLLVDALDECQAGRLKLLDLITSCSTALSHVKWIVSSRNWLEIEERLERVEKIPLSLELNEESVSAAVELYVEEKVRRLAEKKMYGKETATEVRSYLLLNARDTFLWVALVCRNLEKVRATGALKTLHTFPAGLDALYERMVRQIRAMDDADDVDLCMQVLAIVSSVYRPITLEELQSFIERPQVTDGTAWLEDIVRLCGSFLAIRDRDDILCSPVSKRLLVQYQVEPRV